MNWILNTIYFIYFSLCNWIEKEKQIKVNILPSHAKQSNHASNVATNNRSKADEYEIIVSIYHTVVYIYIFIPLSHTPKAKHMLNEPN